jgi:hypothetical protein
MGQAVHVMPHSVRLSSRAQWSLQRWVPAPQVKSQRPPVQTGMAPVGAPQAMQPGPHADTESPAQTPPQKL